MTRFGINYLSERLGETHPYHLECQTLDSKYYHKSKNALKTDTKKTPTDECYGTILYGDSTAEAKRQRSSLNLEAKSSHASLVLLDRGLALLLRVLGLGEEHAVVASSLLGFANAAGLEWKGRVNSLRMLDRQYRFIPWASRTGRVEQALARGQRRFYL